MKYTFANLFIYLLFKLVHSQYDGPVCRLSSPVLGLNGYLCSRKSNNTVNSLAVFSCDNIVSDDDKRIMNSCSVKLSNDGKVAFLCGFLSDDIPDPSYNGYYCITQMSGEYIYFTGRGGSVCKNFTGQLPARSKANNCWDYSKRDTKQSPLMLQVNNCTSQCFKSLPKFEDISQNLCPTLTENVKPFYSSCCSLGNNKVLYDNYRSLVPTLPSDQMASVNKAAACVGIPHGMFGILTIMFPLMLATYAAWGASVWSAITGGRTRDDPPSITRIMGLMIAQLTLAIIGNARCRLDAYWYLITAVILLPGVARAASGMYRIHVSSHGEQTPVRDTRSGIIHLWLIVLTIILSIITTSGMLWYAIAFSAVGVLAIVMIIGGAFHIILATITYYGIIRKGLNNELGPAGVAVWLGWTNLGCIMLAIAVSSSLGEFTGLGNTTIGLTLAILSMIVRIGILM